MRWLHSAIRAAVGGWLAFSTLHGALVPVSAAPTPFNIVAEFYPLYVTLLNITDGVPDVRVANMVPTTTGCPEDYQLTPGDLKLLSKANVLVVNGAGLEGYLDRLAAQCPQLKVITSSAGLDLLTIDGELNPHLWVSPSMAARQTRVIASALSTADPIHAELYQKNAAAYALRQEAFGRKMHEALADAPVRQLVAFHDSLPYLARDLNLNILAVIEPAPGQNPSARELADVVLQVRHAPGPVALISEIDAKNPAAEVLSRELGQPCYDLDTVTGGPLDPASAKEAYFVAMEKNLSILRVALGSKDNSPTVSAAK
jgi:zinc transport system substrate-binding protein